MRLTRRDMLLFIRLSRPHFLLGGFILYALGVSIASYLGHSIDTGLYLMGQGIITCIQLMTHYLNEYYDAPADNQNPGRTPFSGGSGALGPEGLPRRTALYAGIAALTLAATLVGLLLVRGSTSLLAWLFLLFVFCGAYAYSAPPFQLSHSGYGELVASTVVAGFLPAFAFSLHTGQLHRLILMTTVPLIALHFAMLITFTLPDYATDLKYNKRNLMVRIGWKTAMRMHDAALLFAGLSLLLAFLNGLPWRVSLGTLIVLPLGIAQIWQMARIQRGDPPPWATLTWGGLLLFGLTAYLEWVGFMLS
ncbi:MAG: prenyltransferase [Anaerolineales bacterium]|nr:MAG: prenyltransferase [Anaerolineales bacterium]